MRTLIVILIGLTVLIVLEITARYTGKEGKKRFNAPLLFIILWLGFTAIDIYFGMQAGYGLLEELLIHAVIFVVPAAAAWYISKK